jgi:hypothetical protein
MNTRLLVWERLCLGMCVKERERERNRESLLHLDVRLIGVGADCAPVCVCMCVCASGAEQGLQSAARYCKTSCKICKIFCNILQKKIRARAAPGRPGARARTPCHEKSSGGGGSAGRCPAGQTRKRVCAMIEMISTLESLSEKVLFINSESVVSIQCVFVP